MRRRAPLPADGLEGSSAERAGSFIAPAANRPPTVIREWIAAGLVVLAFTVVIARLYDVQIRRGREFARLSLENFVQTLRLPHDRGDIVDQRGTILVANRTTHDVFVTPAFLPPTERFIERLGAAAGLARAEVKSVSFAFLKSVDEDGPPILLARELDEEAVARVNRMVKVLDLPREAVALIPSEGGAAAFLDPRHLPSTARVVRRLVGILEMDRAAAQAFRVRLDGLRGLDRYRPLLVRHDLPAETTAELEWLIDLGELPGVSLGLARTRDYRFGPLAAHVLGYVNELTPTELETKKDGGYRLGDLIGRRGVEAAFEDDLRGLDGSETVVVDSKGRPQETRLASSLKGEVGGRVPPRSGNRVVLALDTDLQAVAEKAFGGQAGAVVALDPRDGRILVMTSTPSFDPNLVSGYLQPKERARLLAIEARRPWRFRAIQDHFAPGSTFKVVTGLAGLKARAVGIGEATFCGGAFQLGTARFRCWKDAGHGYTDAVTALAHSCDVYYYTVGARLGLDPIAEMALELGFGRATGVDLLGETSGIMPTKNWYQRRGGYTLGAAVNASIGQGAVTVTPIQLAVAYAAIANGGTVFQPNVALRVESPDGKAVRRFAPRIARKLELPPEAIARVREGLKQVVNAPYGTARRHKQETVVVSGKTGTAQVAKLGQKRVKAAELPYELRDHAWFAAYAPADAPEIVVVVLNEHGGSGGQAAAPAAIEVIKAWQARRSPGIGLEVATDGAAAGPGQEDEWPAD